MKTAPLLMVFLVLTLLLSACGTLQVSVYTTPTPDFSVTQTIDSLKLQNALLAEEAATPNPGSLTLSMTSLSEEIRLRMLNSHRFFENVWADGEIRTYLEGQDGDKPVQTLRVQVWADQPSERFRVLTGNSGLAPEQVTISDGQMISLWSFPAGQVESYNLSINAGQEFTPPEQVTDTIHLHPLGSQMGTPLSDMLFPAPLAQRGGTYLPVRPESVAGRAALVVDWFREPGTRVDRFWLDNQTGVILRWQNFSKVGGDELASEMELYSIVYDGSLPADLFSREVGTTPRYAQDPSGTVDETPAAVATPVDSEAARSAGEITFTVRDYGTKRVILLRFSGLCLLEKTPCPAPESVTGYPNRLLSRVEPLAWSPDANWAALSSGDSSYGVPARLYRYDGTNSVWLELYEADQVGPPLWSPDGRWIAAAVEHDEVLDLMVISPEDGHALNLTQGEFTGQDNSMAPLHWMDAGTLLISVTQGPSTSVYLVQIEDGERDLLTRVEGKNMPPILSPDSQWMASPIQTDTGSSLQVHNMDGEEAIEIASFQNGSITMVVWSADGSRLAFIVNRSSRGSTSQDVYVLGRDGTGMQQVFSSLAIQQLVWSPDGAHLIIAAQNNEGHHYLYHTDLGSNRTEILSAEGLRLDQDWLAPTWVIPGG